MTVALFAVGTETIAADFIRSPPAAVITLPLGTVTTSTTSVSWTYTSPLSRAQTAFRVKLRNTAGDVTFYDSGTTTGAGTTIATGFLLSSTTIYVAVVTVFDGFDWSAEATFTFGVESATVNSYLDNLAVGSVYEIGINGVGYMLRDHPDKDLKYRRLSIPLQIPARFATSDTPFSQAIERYTFVGFVDFVSGAGQRQRDRLTSVPDAYWNSESINPFVVGQLSLLPTVIDSGLGTVCNFTAVASDLLFTVTGTNTLKSQSTLGGAATSFTIAAAGTIIDFTSDGTNWYATDGVGIFRGATAVDPGAAWSTIATKTIRWTSDRLSVAAISGGATANEYRTIVPAGTLEAIRHTLPVGTTIRTFASGNGYVWYAADRFDHSVIWAYHLGTTEAPFVAMELPQGQSCTAVGFYLGNLMVRAKEVSSTGTARAIIYRCATSAGQLVPKRVLDFDNNAVDHGPGDFAGDDQFVAFTWRSMSSGAKSGFGVIDLATGGWAKWLFGTTNGAVTNIVAWKGRWLVAIQGEGILYESLVPVATGWLQTSMSSLASNLQKLIDEIRLSCDPIPNGGSIAVAYTLDGGSSYTAASTLSTVGAKSAVTTLATVADNIGLQLTLNATVTSPVLKSAIMRLHAVSLSDQQVVLPVNCADVVAGINGRPIPEQNSLGTGAGRARALEELMGSRVKFQDVDWAATKASTIWEVHSVEVDSVGEFQPNAGRQVQAQTAVVTLRRGFK